MNLLDIVVKITADSSGVDDGMDSAKKKTTSWKNNVEKASKMTAKSFAVAQTAITKVVDVIGKVIESTSEYIVAQGKLNTAFETAGYSADTAQEAYTGLYKILGDTDTATETAQLMAKLARNQEDFATWTNIAAGVNGTFGDSLPINGLIEAANETAKVGQVTGVLADALNWAGISEDDFNESLANCSGEAERNSLIMNTLSGTYSDAADSFYKNNEQVIKSRENQVKLQESTAKLGEKFQELKNNFLDKLTPTFIKVMDAGMQFIDKVSKALDDSGLIEAIGSILEIAVGLLDPLADLIVTFLPALKVALDPVAKVLALIADAANVVAGIFTWDFNRIGTALGMNVSKGQLSTYQKVVYGDTLKSTSYSESAGGWTGTGGYIEAGTGKYVPYSASNSTTNNYNINIDSSNVQQFNDVVNIAQNQRRTSRMGGG